jgi:hypothetical protein
MTDQPALGPDGQLLDASKIEWYNDPDDTHPIQPLLATSDAQHGTFFNCINSQVTILTDIFSARSSARTATGTRLAAAIAAEKLNEFGDPDQLYRRRPAQPRNSRPSVAKRKRTAIEDVDTDADDDNFAASSTEDGSGDDDVVISNEEVFNKKDYFTAQRC